MSDNLAKDIVDFAGEDKPNKAADAFDKAVGEKIAAIVNAASPVVANQMVGQEYEEPEEEQLELDLEVEEDQDESDSDDVEEQDDVEDEEEYQEDEESEEDEENEET